jgi:hypothetical protein
LIEAAASGALKPETFEECLLVNDKLTNILADVEKDPGGRQPLIPVASASVSGAGADNTDIESSNINEDMNKLSMKADDNALLGGKTTGLDSDDTDKKTADLGSGLDVLQPTEPALTTLPKADDDDFDAFFRDRTTADGSQS